MNYLTRAPVALTHLVEIGEAARCLSVTPRTLRHYEDRGLVRSRRLARNVRGYDLETLEQLRAIIALRAVGLPISAIGAILSLRGEPDVQTGALRKALAEALHEQRAQIERLVDLIDALSSDGVALPPVIAVLRAVEPPTMAP